MHGCPKTLLQHYIDRELLPSEKVLVEEHLRSCKNCRRELNRLKILDWDLHSMPEIPVPGELSHVRHITLDRHFQRKGAGQGEKGARGPKTRGVLQMQYHTFRYTLRFFHYMPGSKAVQKSLKHIGQYPSIASRRCLSTQKLFSLLR